MEGKEEEKGERTCFLYLWVHIQDADFPCFHHLMYGADLCPIQIPVILAVLQKPSIFDVTFHFTASHEGIHLPVPLVHLWFSGGD